MSLNVFSIAVPVAVYFMRRDNATGVLICSLMDLELPVWSGGGCKHVCKKIDTVSDINLGRLELCYPSTTIMLASPAYASCNESECDLVIKSSFSAATNNVGMTQCGTC